MTKTPATKPRKVSKMASEYRFDYSKARPNRFADRMKSDHLARELSKLDVDFERQLADEDFGNLPNLHEKGALPSDVAKKKTSTTSSKIQKVKKALEWLLRKK